MGRFLFLFLLVGLLNPLLSSATNFYVSKNGSGADGTSWTTAWRELSNIVWGQVRPGDTIYIDGGQTPCPALGPGYSCGMVYNSTLTIGASGTSGSPITIRLAPDANRNGTVIIDGGITSWSTCSAAPSEPTPPSAHNGAGTRQTGISFGSSQWVVLDGTKWGGIEVRNHTRYGVSLGASKNSIARYLKVHHNTDPAVSGNSAVGITQGYESANNLLSRSEIFRNGQDATRGGGDNFTMEENYIHDQYCNHPDGFQAFIPTGNGDVPDNAGLMDGITIRRNVFKDIRLQPIFIGENNYLSPPTGSPGHNSWAQNVDIHDNLIIHSHDAIKSKHGSTTDWDIHHNTVVNGVGYIVEWGGIENPGARAPMTIRSNIFYNTPNHSDPWYDGRVSALVMKTVNGDTSYTNNCEYQIGAKNGNYSGTGNINTNPLFTNSSTGDFSSQASACTGRGACITSLSKLLSDPTCSGQSNPTPVPTIATTPVPTPTIIASNIWSWMASAGTISAPFSVSSGSPSYVSQSTQTLDPATAGRAAYQFSLLTPGKYVVRLNVNAANTASDSLFANIDSEPGTTDVWDFGPTVGFVTKLLSIRGTGSVEAAQFKPKVYDLTAGVHSLIIRGREPNAQFSQVSLSRLGDVNLDGLVNSTDIRQSLIGYGQTNQNSDMNSDSKTSIQDTMSSVTP
jgi:hypothetical protein